MKINKRSAAGALILLLVICLESSLTAAPPVWGNLETGPFAVGFRTIESFDHSRNFRFGQDSHGEAQPGERARPVVAAVWYPAESTNGEPAMLYSEYTYPMPEDERFIRILARLQDREIYQTLFPGLRLDYIGMEDLMHIRMAAVRNAPIRRGPLPLVIYYQELGSSWSENAILCEYLASHGFVVMATPSLGTYLIGPDCGQIDLETQVRDREYALAQLHALGEVDFNKQAVIGNRGGCLLALRHQMQRLDLEAMVAIGSWAGRAECLETAVQNEIIAPQKIDIPVLNLTSEYVQPNELAIFDSLIYASLYRVRFDSLPNFGFSDYSLMRDYILPDTSAARLALRQRYETSCHLIKDFLKAIFESRHRDSLLAISNVATGTPTVPRIEKIAGKARPMAEAEFVQIILEEGATRAEEVHHQFQADFPGETLFREQVLYLLANEFTFGGNSGIAGEPPGITLYRITLQAYPQSSRSWLGIGQAHLYSGNDGSEVPALDAFKKALELVPTDPGLEEHLRPVYINYLQGTIARLQTPPDSTGS